MALLRPLALVGVLLTSGRAVAAPADLVALPSEPGRWSARTELMYDGATKSLVRREIRVWDLHPSRHLVFTWASEPSRAATAGAAAGVGHLTWRPNGTPSYDLSGIAIDYQGQVAAGRPEEVGTERDADGLSYEGGGRRGYRTGRVICGSRRAPTTRGRSGTGRPRDGASSSTSTAKPTTARFGTACARATPRRRCPAT